MVSKSVKSYILEFTVIKPYQKGETIGDKYVYSQQYHEEKGDIDFYIEKKTNIKKTLFELLWRTDNYRATKIMQNKNKINLIYSIHDFLT